MYDWKVQNWNVFYVKYCALAHENTVQYARTSDTD